MSALLPDPAPSLPGPNAHALADALGRIAAGLRAPRISLRDFMRRAWAVVNPGTQYREEWHLALIAEHLEAVHLGQIRQLCINLPPRLTKSFTLNCFGPWEWTENPSERFLYSGHSQKLCTRHSLDRRAIVESAWYLNAWGHYVRMAADQNLKTEFQNTARGHMITIPVGGAATGSGGKRLVMDDLMDPKKARSKAMRETTVDFYRKQLLTRLDDPVASAKVIVEQRLHKSDLTGQVVLDQSKQPVVARAGWVHLLIPMEAKTDRCYQYPVSGATHTFKAGELLSPKRFDRLTVDKLAADMGASEAEAQLQQTPEDQEGGLFPRQLWRTLTEPPAEHLSVWSVDGAVKERTVNDYTAGVRIARFDRGFVLTRAYKGRWRFGEMKVKVRDEQELARADVVVIEDKSSGQQLLQEMEDQGHHAVAAVDTKFSALDKVTRASKVQPLFESGKVFVLKAAPDGAAVLEECAAFPGGDYDDYVDAVVNGLYYLSTHDPASNRPQEHAVEAEAGIEDGL